MSIRISSLSGVGVEVAAQDGGYVPRRARRAMNAADRPHLLLADVALVEPPVEVGAEHLERPARAVDVGPHARCAARRRRAAPAAASTSWPVIGQRTARRCRTATPSRSSRVPYDVVEARAASAELGGLAATAVVRPHLLQADDVGVEARRASRRWPAAAPPTARTATTGSRSAPAAAASTSGP